MVGASEGLDVVGVLVGAKVGLAVVGLLVRHVLGGGRAITSPAQQFSLLQTFTKSPKPPPTLSHACRA